MSRVVVLPATTEVVPTTTDVVRDDLVALRSAAGIALIVATVLASTVGFYDAFVVNVAVPAIGRDLGAGVATLQWVLTGYLVTVAALLLVSGAFADRFGRRRVLITGLLVMLVGSVLCAIAPSGGSLIAARVVQGVGGALVVPSSLALLNGTLRVADRARGIGVWAGLGTLGTTVGPYAGGWLFGHVSWTWVFLVNVPVILGGLLALRRVPERSQGRRQLSPDVLGALLAVLGLGGVICALTDGSAHGWTDARVLVAVAGAVGVVSLAALLPVERRLAAPMVRLSLFASRQFDAINVTTVLFYGGFSAVSYLLVLQCELQLGYSAAQAGAALIPWAAVFVAISPLSGALVSRVGPRWLVVSGMLTVAAAFAWLGAAAHHGASYAGAILPPVALWGFGLGLTVTALTAAVLAAVRDPELGEASAINDAASRLGGVIAVAAIPAVTGGSSLGHALADGYQPAMTAAAALTAAAAAIAALFVSSRRMVAPRVAPPAPYQRLPVARLRPVLASPTSTT